MSNTNTVKNVRKKLEFEEFIKMIEEKQVHTWVMCARALNVRPATITEWKKHPKAKKAIIRGIDEALENMQRAGKDDWRMWREKLRLLGVDKEYKFEHHSKGLTNEGESIEVKILEYN